VPGCNPLEIVEDWVRGGTVAGAAAVVVGRDGVLAERYAGVRRRAAEDPVAADTRFALASLTKPLVACACLIAVEEGSLELDGPLRDGFTLRHLLSHAAGLPYAGDRAARPVDPPGSYRRYSNAGYLVAGAELAEAAGVAAGDYLHEAVLAPLAMDASLGLDHAAAGRTATVQEPGLGEGGAQLFNSASFRAAASTAGGGYATARAYGAFLRMLLREGRGEHGAILAAETVDELLAPQFGALPGEIEGVGRYRALCWGLGFDVRGRRQPHWAGSALSATASTHFGASGSLAWLDRERGLGLVALANRGTYSGWWARDGGWADLTAAVVGGYA
jgi:CubicO group peptidase (beta-lactamase class C family)